MDDTPHTPSPPAVCFVLASLPYGSMILNRLDDKNGAGVGADLLNSGAHEGTEIDMLSDLAFYRARTAGPGVVVIDGGANIGTYTVPLAKRMTGWGSVVAFEAQERIYFALAGNIALNNCFNARAIHAALGAKTGPLSVPYLNHQMPANFGGLSLKPGIKQDPGQPVTFTAETMVTVRLTSLDDLKIGRLDILKLDIEGMEPDALDGARETIDRLKPIIFAEVTSCGNIAVAQRLPDYELIPCGMCVLAVHKSDALRDKITITDGMLNMELAA